MGMPGIIELIIIGLILLLAILVPAGILAAVILTKSRSRQQQLPKESYPTDDFRDAGNDEKKPGQ